MTGNGSAGAATKNSGTEVTFQRCEVFDNNLAGLFAESNSVLRVAKSTITRNVVGLHNGDGTATVESFSNNVIRGNLTETSGTITNVVSQ